MYRNMQNVIVFPRADLALFGRDLWLLPNPFLRVSQEAHSAALRSQIVSGDLGIRIEREMKYALKDLVWIGHQML
jgi:hypothetical protein